MCGGKFNSEYLYINKNTNNMENDKKLKNYIKTIREFLNENYNKVLSDEKLQDLTLDELYEISYSETDEEFIYNLGELNTYQIKGKNKNEYLYIDKENSFSREGARCVIHYVYKGSNKNGDEMLEFGTFNDDEFEKAHLIAFIIANRGNF